MGKPLPLKVVDDGALYVSEAKVYPREVSGLFQRLRHLAVFVLLGLYYGVAWVSIDGQQLVLWDLPARKFHVFGLVFWPQDFIFLALLLVMAGLSLFFFTAMAGRLWCGYACPQTVWTEVFIWMERWTEGDRAKRMKLDAAPWSREKLLRKGSKHLLWAAFALWTGFTFVGYFTPIRDLGARLLPFEWGGYETFWTLFYALATWGNAGFLREQVCKYMCPYARFQSAMFDRDTLIISYDAERGEPRGTRGRKTDLAAAKLGHCIDCELCVQVCPTGIDIRKGLQYECIGCAACIDVCNGVMDKMQYPRGLIRYDTLNGMQQHLDRKTEWWRVFRPRVLIYSAVLWLIIAALGYGLWTRPAIRVDVVRDRGVLSRVVEDGWVENVYRLQVMNATEQVQSVKVSVAGLQGIQLAALPPITLAGAEARWVPVAVRIPPEAAAQAGAGSHAIRFDITAVGEDPVVEKSTFMVPR
jgi:cytochrome c oxidase accessory protein FixG